MTTSKKQTLREKYSRLKKALQKMLRPKERQPLPQLVLEPVRHQPSRNNFYGNPYVSRNVYLKERK